MRDKRVEDGFFEKYINWALKNFKETDYKDLYAKSSIEHKHGLQKLTPLLGGYTNLAVGAFPRMYSRGDALQEIKDAVFIPVIDRYVFLCDEMEKLGVSYIFYLSSRPKNYIPYVHDGFQSEHHSVYSWLCWFICLDVSSTLISKMAPYLCEAGNDRLIDTILSKYEPSRVCSDKCMFPETFGLLEQVIDSDPNKRAKLIKEYLEEWPKLMGHLNGFSSIGIGSISTSGIRDYDGMVNSISGYYQGLWAWEAALVVKFFNIDDQSFKDNEFYPYDLVHFSSPL